MERKERSSGSGVKPMELCRKCGGLFGILILLSGLGFLLQDWGWWAFWGLNWWTVAFLLCGIAAVSLRWCKECQACSVCDHTAKKKR